MRGSGCRYAQWMICVILASLKTPAALQRPAPQVQGAGLVLHQRQQRRLDAVAVVGEQLAVLGQFRVLAHRLRRRRADLHRGGRAGGSRRQRGHKRALVALPQPGDRLGAHLLAVIPEGELVDLAEVEIDVVLAGLHEAGHQRQAAVGRDAPARRCGPAPPRRRPARTTPPVRRTGWARRPAPALPGSPSASRLSPSPLRIRRRRCSRGPGSATTRRPTPAPTPTPPAPPE